MAKTHKSDHSVSGVYYYDTDCCTDQSGRSRITCEWFNSASHPDLSIGEITRYSAGSQSVCADQTAAILRAVTDAEN